MEKVLMFITNHYIYFIIAAGVLIISAIGYVVDNKQQELSKAKDVPEEDKKDTKDKPDNKKRNRI